MPTPGTKVVAAKCNRSFTLSPSGKSSSSFRKRVHDLRSRAGHDSPKALILLRNIQDPFALQHGSGIAPTRTSPAQTRVLPRLLNRRLFRNPNRFTESVPIGTLLLQTAVASIHSGLGAKSECIQDLEDNWEICRWLCSISLE